MMKEPINIMMLLNHKENSTFDIAQILPAAGESPDGACQMYINGSCNVTLSYNRDDIRRCLQGIREAFAVLAELGYPVEFHKLKWVFAIPDFILTQLFQRVLRSKIAAIGMARHLRNAQEERVPE